MVFGSKEKSLFKEISELFYQGEELKTALGVMSDVYGCMVTVVYEQNQINKVLCSTELNIDRLDALNHQLARIRITEEEVLSYDGFYKSFKTYPLKTSVLEGALLLDGDKTLPGLSDELLRLLAMYARHEKLSRDAKVSLLLDATTGLKNRDGLLKTLVEEKESEEKSFAYLACIRLLNRTEILNKLGCNFDNRLTMKCSNEILRRLKRQVYRIGTDIWAVLFVKSQKLNEDSIRKDFSDFIDDLSDVIDEAIFYVSFTEISDDPFYSLFLCESSAIGARESEVEYKANFSAGELKDYMHTRSYINVEESQMRKVGDQTEGADFYQESAVYNLNRADAAPISEEEPLVSEDNYTELDENFDPVSESDEFVYGESFEELEKAGAEEPVVAEEGESGKDETNEGSDEE